MIKNLPANAGTAGDIDSIPGSGRSPGRGNGNLLQYSYQDNSVDRGAWWASVRGGRKESGTTEMTEHSHTTRTEVTRRHLQLSIKELYKV